MAITYTSDYVKTQSLVPDDVAGVFAVAHEHAEQSWRDNLVELAAVWTPIMEGRCDSPDRTERPDRGLDRSRRRKASPHRTAMPAWRRSRRIRSIGRTGRYAWL